MPDHMKHAAGDLITLTSRGKFVPGLAHLAGQTGVVMLAADSSGMLIAAFGDDVRGVPCHAVQGA